jgi:hypothetical protein
VSAQHQGPEHATKPEAALWNGEGIGRSLYRDAAERWRRALRGWFDSPASRRELVWEDRGFPKFRQIEAPMVVSSEEASPWRTPTFEDVTEDEFGVNGCLVMKAHYGPQWNWWFPCGTWERH